MSFFRKKIAQPQTADWIIAGLGNPGRQYASTRHNCGFLACDIIAREAGVKLDKLKWKALYGLCVIGGQNVMLMKPQTFMNLSGGPVMEAAAKYKIPPERIIVIQDDVNLAPGKLRVRRDGSDGGHNGIKDIIYKLQSDGFPRVKVGVGRPDGDMAEHVLSPMSLNTRTSLGDAAKAAQMIITDGVDAAMARYNGGFFGVSE